MKKYMDSFEGRVWRVISEPGDLTRYDYIVIKDYDDYCFAPYRSNLRYPQKLNFYDVAGTGNHQPGTGNPIVSETDKEIAERENCNPWTVRECITTVIELQERRILDPGEEEEDE